MTENRVFCFWSIPGTMPGYLQLCLQTWKRNLPGYEIVLLDRSSMREYVEGVYDVDRLARYAWPQQKDALMMAVLHRHGGIFMDMDTIALSDIAPLVHELRQSQLVIFWRYFAFMAARPGSLILERCVDRVRRRLEGPVISDADIVRRWGYLGNEVFEDVLENMSGDVGRLQRIAVRAATRVVERYPSEWRRRLLRYRVATEADRFSVWRWRLALDAFHPGRLTMLDRDAHGFLPERLRFPRVPVLERDKYRAFWFEDSGARMRDVFHANQPVIALHGSWTPKWYRELGPEDVLGHHCLLSRTLRKLLA